MKSSDGLPVVTRSCSRPATARVAAVSAVYLFQLGSGPRDFSCTSRRSRVAQPALSSLAVCRLQRSSSDPQQLSVHDSESGCRVQGAGPRCPLVCPLLSLVPLAIRVCIRVVELRAAAHRITVMARTDPKGRAARRCEWRRKISGTRQSRDSDGVVSSSGAARLRRWCCPDGLDVARPANPDRVAQP